MSTVAAELVERARAQGLTLEAAGDRLRVGPRDRLTPELRAALLEHKAGVLAALADLQPPPPALGPVPAAGDLTGGPALDPVTTREMLGPRPSPAALGALQSEVLAVLRALKCELATSALGAGLLLVRGRPLADFLDLDTLAALLRRVPWRDATGSSWPATLPGLGPKTIVPLDRCACGAGTWVRYGATPLCLAHARARGAGGAR